MAGEYLAPCRESGDTETAKRGLSVRRIGIVQAGLVAALALAAITTTTAAAAAPSVFMMEEDERIAVGHPASVLFQITMNGASCVEVVSGTVTVTGKPTAKLTFPGEEIQLECYGNAALAGFVEGVELTSKGRITVRSKGGIVMDTVVGSRRCAYEAKTLKGAITLPSQGLEGIRVTSPAKLNSKLSSPGCPTIPTMESVITLRGPTGELEAQT
jgi:hypothetical protein